MSVLGHWSSDIRLWVLKVLNTGLKLGPVIVEVTGEGAIGMSILGHWTSDIWLRILGIFDSCLKLCPVIVEMAGESGIWMSILWHRPSNIRLWIFSKFVCINQSKECSDRKRHLLFHLILL